MNSIAPAITLTIAFDSDGDNYFLNEAVLHGNGRRILYGGEDWKHAVYTAAGTARVLGVSVILNANYSFTPDRIEAAVTGGREAFFAALGIKVEAA